MGRWHILQRFAELRADPANARRRGSDQVIGLVKMMQAEAQDYTGRSGWMKGCVESLMRLIDKHDRLYRKAYIGNNTKSRHREADAYAKSHHDKLPTMAEYESTLRDFMAAENRRPRKQFDGLSPLQKFEQTRIPERRLPKQAEEFLRRRPQRVRVSNRGIGIRISGKAVYFGQRDPNVWQRQGQRLVAYMDDDDLSNILVSDLDGRPLFYAENDGLIGIDTATLREAAKAQKRAAKIRREHFENVDFSVIPTADVAVQLKRKAAESEAAKLGAKLEKRPVTKTIIYPQHSAQMKEVQKRRALRQAVGAEIAAPDGTTLTELFSDVPIGLTGSAGPDITDIDFGQEDHPVTDCFDDLLGGPTP